MKRLPRITLVGFLAALAAVHGIVGWWQPVQATDWDALQWDARHPGSWLATHFTSSNILAYALAHGALLHAVVCAIAGPAIVLGAFTIAHRRLPRLDAWDDVLGVLATSALIWIAQPRAGFTWFHRTNVAWHVCGCAAALWFAAPLRCGWRVRRSGMVVLAAAGFIVGTSTRQIATATLVSVAVWLRRTPIAERARWMWVALGALLAGTILGFIGAPRVTASRMIELGFVRSLDLLNVPIRAGGQLIALVLLLALAELVLGPAAGSAPHPAGRAGSAPAWNAELPDPRETRAWLWTWLGICVACLFGPRYSEATLLPATLVLVIAALPYVRWLCSARVLRWTIAAIAVGVHAVAWPTALVLFARLGGEFRDRVARLERTPAGSIAVVAPYSEVLPSSWFFGEDWARASRQLVGIDVYHVRDIEFEPRFGRLEDNPRLVIQLEASGLSDDQLRAASPVYWASDPGAAREQFTVFMNRARRAAGPAFTARLAVDGLDFPERRGRPLQVAWYDHGAVTVPRVTRGNPDPNDRRKITLPAAVAAAHPEAYVVHAGSAAPLAYDGAAYHIQPLVAGLIAVVACAPRRCLLVDAFLPKF